ncbi:MAG: hypothetical protein R2881_10685 [Eubacteriales bacterium]
MAPERILTNAITKVGSSDRVEYAVKLPTDDGTPVYLPIDSKFHRSVFQSAGYLRVQFSGGDCSLHPAAY